MEIATGTGRTLARVEETCSSNAMMRKREKGTYSGKGFGKRQMRWKPRAHVQPRPSVEGLQMGHTRPVIEEKHNLWQHLTLQLVSTACRTNATTGDTGDYCRPVFCIHFERCNGFCSRSATRVVWYMHTVAMPIQRISR